MPDFTTGPSQLPDVGVLSYNGCTFSAYFESNVSGEVVRDNANRTTKYMKFNLSVEGYATLPDGATSINGRMATLYQLLTAQGGALVYTGRGFDIVANQQGGGPFAPIVANSADVAWGPIPKMVDFKPLGAGRSAKVKWEVAVHLPQVNKVIIANGLPFLQFNYETNVAYGDDAFSTLSVKGTMEIPLTRTPNQGARSFSKTVDDMRTQLDARIFSGIDLSRFRVTRREYPVSRDKRTMEFDVQVEEKPYMDLPPGCTVARGSYDVRPARAGMGLVSWLCTLRTTYVVRHDTARRASWFAFLTLLRLRMGQSELGKIPDLNGNQNPGADAIRIILGKIAARLGNRFDFIDFWRRRLLSQNQNSDKTRKAFLIDFHYSEGMYLDSKNITFSASWKLVTTFSHILRASGLWKKVPEVDAGGNNLWAASMADVMKSQSWLPNRLDPAADIIVDFGGR